MKRLLVILFLAAAALSWPLAVMAADDSASMRIEPSTGLFAQGNNVTLAVVLDTGGEQVNAVDFEVNFDQGQLEFVGFDSSSTAFSIEAESYRDGGNLYVARGSGAPVGGVVNVTNLVFRVTGGSGNALLAFHPSAQVLRASDNSNVLGALQNANLTLYTDQSDPTPTPVQTADPTPPQVTPTPIPGLITPTPTPTPSSTPIPSTDPTAGTGTSNDTVAPTISNLDLKQGGDGGITVTWSTSEPSKAVLNYGLDEQLGLTLQSNELNTEHALTIDGSVLQPSTKYFFRVFAIDAAGNPTQSSLQEFESPAGSDLLQWLPYIAFIGIVFLLTAAVVGVIFWRRRHPYVQHMGNEEVPEPKNILTPSNTPVSEASTSSQKVVSPVAKSKPSHGSNVKPHSSPVESEQGVNAAPEAQVAMMGVGEQQELVSGPKETAVSAYGEGDESASPLGQQVSEETASQPEGLEQVTRTEAKEPAAAPEPNPTAEPDKSASRRHRMKVIARPEPETKPGTDPVVKAETVAPVTSPASIAAIKPGAAEAMVDSNQATESKISDEAVQDSAASTGTKADLDPGPVHMEGPSVPEHKAEAAQKSTEAAVTEAAITPSSSSHPQTEQAPQEGASALDQLLAQSKAAQQQIGQATSSEPVQESQPAVAKTVLPDTSSEESWEQSVSVGADESGNGEVISDSVNNKEATHVEKTEDAYLG